MESFRTDVCLAQLPLVAVWLAGVVLAVVNLKRYPKPAALTLVAVLVLMVLAVLDIGTSWLLPTAVRRGGMRVVVLMRVLQLWGVVASLVRALAWAGVLWAVFGWRQPASKATSDTQD
ncbi:MAG: hypothetical protein ACUVX9_05085 [Anaerolineae bacterium]